MHKLGILIVCVVLTYAAGTGQIQSRQENSLSVSLGAYASNGFGTNEYYGLRYNYYFLGGRSFVEGAAGFSTLKSRVLENVSKAQLFDSDRLFTYEFVLGYDINPSGYFPYIAAGVAGVNQGGQSNFAGVLGLGKRMPLPGLFGSNSFGLRYDVRDHIFSQRINNSDPFISHNIVFSLGFQVFF
jgi:opacity protein-like surface antigen